MRRPVNGLLALVLWAGLMPAGAQVDPANAQDVRELQAALRFLDYRIDAVTGVYDEQTTRAVRAFEFSLGMGSEGTLSVDELALLEARVAAVSFERFGYRLHGYWSDRACDQDPEFSHGLWLENLVVLQGNEGRYALDMRVPEAPIAVTLGQDALSLTSLYFQAVGARGDVQIFPLEQQLLVLTAGHAHILRICEADLSQWQGQTAVETFLPAPANPPLAEGDE